MSKESTIDPTPEDNLLSTASKLFGVAYLYPYQRLVVSNTLDAAAAAVAELPEYNELARQIVVLPTGSGKTLCFLLPAALLPGVTVVVYPLLALMSDQLRRAEDAGLPAAVLRGGMSRAERKRLFSRLSSGELKLLITNPEMLSLPDVQAKLAAIGVTHFVVDEAHCVTEWGNSFRPLYLELKKAIRQIKPTVCTAFTATASSAVLSQVADALFGDVGARTINADPDRPNISYSVLPVLSKTAAVYDLLRGSEIEKPALVFCRSRGGVEAVARSLMTAISGSDLSAYHAGMPKETRQRVERWFFSSKRGVLVATCAYGLGVDKPDVRTVIHVDVPPSVEAFLQESGRAGRDRQPAESVFLFDPSDLTVAPDGRRRMMERYLTHSGCRRSYLMTCMNSESASCFGCDYCFPDERPKAVRHAALSDQQRTEALHRYVARRKREFTARQLLKQLPWNRDESAETLSSALKLGLVRTVRRGPWRDRVTLKVSRKHLV